MPSEDIIREIDNALKRLKIAPESFNRCDFDTAQLVARRSMYVFVEGNPRVWWLSLKKPFNQIPLPDDSPTHIEKYLPSEGKCWFIPEIGNNTYIVYDAEIKYIVPVLGECYFFEYNVVAKDYTWLMIENEHGQVILSSKKVDQI